MKESSEDISIKNIKEVLEQYEPDYSPQFWENLKKQRPMLEVRLKTLLLKYKFWLSVVAIVGVLVIVNKDTSGLLANKNSAADPLFSESDNYMVSEKPKEITYPEKRAALRHSISDTGISPEVRNISSKDTPAMIADWLPVAYQNLPPVGNAIVEIPEAIDQNSAIPVLLEGIYSGYQFNIPQLLPVKSEVEEIPASKSPSFEKTRNYKFQWPEFNFITTKDENYKKFAGPNKLALFYSTEMHRTHSYNALGVSHGFGISFDGPIRSSVSVSAGLSYQAINFSKTVFLEKVPPHLSSLQPADTNRTFYYIDSTIIKRGSYRFLELPVSLNFKFFETARSQVWFGTGISAIAFLRQNYTSETIVEGVSDEVSSSSAKAWKNIHPLASLNFGLFYRYKLSDRFFLHGSAQYKQHLVPLGSNSLKLNRFNFQAGIIYRFGRED
jgi:hypothetical protein